MVESAVWTLRQKSSLGEKGEWRSAKGQREQRVGFLFVLPEPFHLP